MELKPCPFCGSKDVEYDNDTGHDDNSFRSWISCDECGAKANDEEAWNRRTPSGGEALSEIIAEAKELIRLTRCGNWYGAAAQIVEKMAALSPVDTERERCPACLGEGQEVRGRPCDTCGGIGEL